MIDGIGGWSELCGFREKTKALYPSIWDLELVKKEMDRLLPHIKDGDRILEVGAGDRRFEAKLKTKRNAVTYKSLDIDRTTHQDYYHLDEIEESFDFVFMFEVIEHLTPEEGLSLLRRLGELLADGGALLVGTPNLYHPHRYFGDITHKTPYKYHELGALMMMAGFKNLRAYRVFNDAFLRRVFRLYVGIHLHKYLDLDFAGTVLIEGEI